MTFWWISATFRHPSFISNLKAVNSCDLVLKIIEIESKKEQQKLNFHTPKKNAKFIELPWNDKWWNIWDKIKRVDSELNNSIFWDSPGIQEQA